ncbi:MAG TPA: NAD-dependent epimerase/dehydratase family protein, partial [Patescibacteria group bacterium]|nr:NAD-dependent epimerase/dehydratase family protein [Patescibacteria group bacterium]
MHVLLTGNDGYLGSLLTPELLQRGFQVTGLDTGFYKERSLYRSGPLSAFT